MDVGRHFNQDPQPSNAVVDLDRCSNAFLGTAYNCGRVSCGKIPFLKWFVGPICWAVTWSFAGGILQKGGAFSSSTAWHRKMPKNVMLVGWNVRPLSVHKNPAGALVDSNFFQKSTLKPSWLTGRVSWTPRLVQRTTPKDGLRMDVAGHCCKRRSSRFSEDFTGGRELLDSLISTKESRFFKNHQRLNLMRSMMEEGLQVQHIQPGGSWQFSTGKSWKCRVPTCTTFRCGAFSLIGWV